MALINFLNNTCNIVEKIKTITWWEEVITDSAIYTWIKCYYYSSNAKLNETNEASNIDFAKYKVIVEPNKINIRKNMYITIFDALLWTVWIFIIEEVKMNRLIDWSSDSVQLKIKAVWI